MFVVYTSFCELVITKLGDKSIAWRVEVEWIDVGRGICGCLPIIGWDARLNTD
jgi:hypothetical protein